MELKMWKTRSCTTLYISRGNVCQEYFTTLDRKYLNSRSHTRILMLGLRNVYQKILKSCIYNRDDSFKMVHEICSQSNSGET